MRLNEIIRNLNVGFVVLVIMMAIMMYISVYYNYLIWSDKEDDLASKDDYKWIESL